MTEIIPDNFDEFMKPAPESAEEKTEKQTLEDRFAGERFTWSAKLKEMSSKLRKALDVAELMTEIYTERQRALEYYHYLISLLIKINKNYKKSYAERHEYYSYKAQQLLSNERQKEARIQADLGDLIEKREILDNHAKFMDGTVKTIDNLIFGMKTRIDIEQIARGK